MTDTQGTDLLQQAIAALQGAFPVRRAPYLNH